MNMIKVLIVEDEMLVRVGLRNSIDWKGLDMLVVAEVSNGQLGLDAYYKECPDLIITDLKMPVLDGMEMIRSIRSENDTVELIVLTCMEEFALIKEAMTLGIADYISKFSMRMDEMETVLQKIREKIQQKHSYSDKFNINHVDKAAIKEKVLKNQLFYNFYKDDLGVYVNQLALKMTDVQLVLCIMEFDHYETLVHMFNDYEGQLTKLSILNVLEDLTDDIQFIEIICISKSQYVLVMSFEQAHTVNEIKALLTIITDKMKEVIFKYFNVTVSFGVSNSYSGYGNIKKMYDECQQAIYRKFFVNSGELLFYDTDYKTDFEEKRVLLIKMAEDIVTLPEPYKNTYKAKLEEIDFNTIESVDAIKSLVNEILQWYGNSVGLQFDMISEILATYSHNVQNCGTIDEIAVICEDFVAEIQRKLRGCMSLSKETALAIEYLEKNFQSPIQLTDVAALVGLSANYFSSLFKKETQMSFIEYLNSIRIQKAKFYLTNTYLKSYEIALEVGFSEETYFSKCFKRIVGKSPNEYRKQLLKRWKDELDETGM